MGIYEKFKQVCASEIAIQGTDTLLENASRDWMNLANPHKYSYHFEWMGRPIIQYPQDLVALQEIIWAVQPELIFETGLAHGGSLIFSAAMLELNAACGGPKAAEVLGLDIDIRKHNREAIEAHPMSSRIQMIEGSSIDPSVIEQVKKISRDYKRVMVCLDSNHTHNHVLAELKAYAPLVSLESYCIVFDTIIEDMPENNFLDRAWGSGNNPKTAASEYLKTHPEFEVDKHIQNKLLITVAPDGYLKRIKN
jgi:cephalosporin hydroxylase